MKSRRSCINTPIPRSRRPRLAPKSLLLFLLVSPGPARADAPVIDEIQVTASRRASGAQEVSTAVAIVSSEDIALRNLVTDSLAAQPGTYVQETTPGQGAVIIRGLKGSEVLHLVDGVRMNNAIFRNAPTQYAALVDSQSLERTEVVRGSSASLYGSGAMGGVVNFLTHKPRLSNTGGILNRDLSLMANSADLAQRVSLGIEHGGQKVATLARLSWLNTGNRRPGDGERIPDSEFESRAARFALLLQPSENRRWFFDVQAVSQPRTARVDELIAGFGETEPGSSEFFFEPNERYFGHVEYLAEDALFGATWDLDVSWQKIVDDRRSRNFGSTSRRIEENSSELFVVGVDASGDLANGQWLLGAEWTYDAVDSRRDDEDVATGLRSNTTPRFPDGATIDQASVFSRFEHRPGNRHTLAAGIRFNKTTIELPTLSGIGVSSLSFSDLSGDLGWTFELSESVKLVANLGRGFRAPNIFDLGTLGERPGNRFNIPNPNLDAEHVTQVDVGIKVAGEDLHFELFAFSLDYEDRIESISTGSITPDGRQITQSQNLALADIYGIEFSASIAINDALELSALLNVARGESSVNGEAESPADRMPPYNGRISLQNRPSSYSLFDVYAVFADKQERLSPRDVRDPRIDPQGTPGWLTLNARYSWSYDRWTYTAAIENMLDARYRVHGSGIDARGRNYVFSLSYRW